MHPWRHLASLFSAPAILTDRDRGPHGCRQLGPGDRLAVLPLIVVARVRHSASSPVTPLHSDDDAAVRRCTLRGPEQRSRGRISLANRSGKHCEVETAVKRSSFVLSIALGMLCIVMMTRTAVAQETINQASIGGRIFGPAGRRRSRRPGDRAPDRDQSNGRGDLRFGGTLPVSLSQARAIRAHREASGVCRR